MGRRLGCIAALAALCALLSACDKCGDFQQIRVPGAPASCSGATPR